MEYYTIVVRYQGVLITGTYDYMVFKTEKDAMKYVLESEYLMTSMKENDGTDVDIIPVELYEEENINDDN